MAMAAGLLLLMVPLAVQGATFSDYASENDYCSGVDADGIYDGAPQGDPFTCDANSEDSTIVSTYNGGVLTGCTNAATGAPPAPDASQCTGGFIFNNDDATAGGNFGGDFPAARLVTIGATDPALALATGFNVRSTYMYFADYDDDNNATTPSILAGTTVTTGLGGICVASGGSFGVNVGGTDAWDPPEGINTPAPITILQVVGFRAAVGGAACSLPASGGPRIVTADWSYTEDTGANNDMTAEATLGPIVDNGDGTCSFTWSYAADTASRYGGATGSLDIDGGIFGSFSQAGPAVGASVYEDETTTGIDTLLYGEWVAVAASAWGVGAAYQQDQEGSPLDAPVPGVNTRQCLPGSGFPPDPNTLVEPVCVAIAVSDGAGGWSVPPTGVCASAGGPTLCLTTGNDVSCDPVGAVCNPFNAATVAVATSGASRATLSCTGSGAIADADTAPVAPLPLALAQGVKTSGTWSCDFAFTPSATTAGVHAGTCSDTP